MPVVHTQITGYRHLDQHEQTRYKALAKRMRLDLRREPNNQHDPNAVLVIQDGVTIGYIPRTENAEIAAALDDKSLTTLIRCVCENYPIVDGTRCIAQAKITVTW